MPRLQGGGWHHSLRKLWPGVVVFVSAMLACGASRNPAVYRQHAALQGQAVSRSQICASEGGKVLTQRRRSSFAQTARQLAHKRHLGTICGAKVSVNITPMSTAYMRQID